MARPQFSPMAEFFQSLTGRSLTGRVAVEFEQGPGPGESAGADAWKKGLLVARGCRVRRGVRGPVVEVLRGRGCRVQFVHSWVWLSGP